MTAEDTQAGVLNRSVALSELTPHPHNYNKHDREQSAQLRASLRRFGQVRSIVVQAQEAGGFMVVAGHGLVEAARAEGFRELHADVIPADWSAARVESYMAADNEIARLSNPDQAQLAELVARVQAEGDAELAALAAGSASRLEELLKLLDEGTGREDPGPQLDRAEELRLKWGTAVGQVWGLGAYTRCPKCGKRHEVTSARGVA